MPHETTLPDDWSEACVYKCQICWSFDTTSKALFVEHLSGSHAKSEEEYKVVNHDIMPAIRITFPLQILQEAYLNLIFISSVLECKRCGKNILHSKESIESHLKVKLHLNPRLVETIKELVRKYI